MQDNQESKPSREMQGEQPRRPTQRPTHRLTDRPQNSQPAVATFDQKACGNIGMNTLDYLINIMIFEFVDYFLNVY